MKGLADGAGLKHGRQKLERLPPHLYLALGPGPGPRAPPAKLRAETPGRTDAAAAAGGEERRQPAREGGREGGRGGKSAAAPCKNLRCVCKFMQCQGPARR